MVEAQFMIRGQIIALCGMWALNGVWAHAVIYIRSQAVLSLEFSTIPGLLILTQSMSRVRVQSSACLKNWILCPRCDFSCLALFRHTPPLPRHTHMHALRTTCSFSNRVCSHSLWVFAFVECTSENKLDQVYCLISPKSLRIKSKFVAMSCKSLHDLSPPLLSDLITYNSPVLLILWPP